MIISDSRSPFNNVEQARVLFFYYDKYLSNPVIWTVGFLASHEK